MKPEKTAGKAGRPSRSLAEEIQAAEQRLKALKDRQREQERQERERNQKMILNLIRAEGLDSVPFEQWRAVLPKLRTLLKVDAADGGGSGRVAATGVGASGQAAAQA